MPYPSSALIPPPLPSLPSSLLSLFSSCFSPPPSPPPSLPTVSSLTPPTLVIRSRVFRELQLMVWIKPQELEDDLTYRVGVGWEAGQLIQEFGPNSSEIGDSQV